MAGMLSSCTDVFISCGAGGKMPHCYFHVPQLPKKSVVVSVLVGQPNCSPGFWVHFNSREMYSNVWNTAFALKGMLSSCFRLLVERISHSPSLSFLLFLLFTN